MNLKERTINTHTLYQGRVFKLKSDKVILPNGKTSTRDVISHPGAVAILPLLAPDRILLVSQYRYAIEKVLLEVPAGTIDLNESPIECAYRELLEETGYQAKEVRKLIQFYVAPGYSSELLHVYVANELKKTKKRTEFDEFIHVKIMSLVKAFQLVADNTIQDAKTICSLLYYAYEKRIPWINRKDDKYNWEINVHA